jgi:hypothetical protein
MAGGDGVLIEEKKIGCASEEEGVVGEGVVGALSLTMLAGK